MSDAAMITFDEAQAPPIPVERPRPGEAIRGTINVRGTAQVREAIRLQDSRVPAGGSHPDTGNPFRQTVGRAHGS